MQRVYFGNTGIVASPLGLGGAQFGGVFAGSDRRTWIRLIHAAMDGGISFLDTADFYTQGESEKLIGEAVGRKRHDIVIATKFGYCLPTQKRFGGHIKPFLRPIIKRLGIRRAWVPASATGALSQNFSPEYIPQSVEQSLKRLKTDYIDVLQLHSPPVSVIRNGDWIDVLERLKREGKIRCYGVACEHADDGLEALQHADVSILQVSLNLLERKPTQAVIPLASANSVAIIARQPFAAGFLTREIDHLNLLKMGDENWPLQRSRIQAFRRLAHREGRSPAALALGFVRGVAGVSTVLMSVSSEAQLAENMRCFEESALSPALCAEMNEIRHESPQPAVL